MDGSSRFIRDAPLTRRASSAYACGCDGRPSGVRARPAPDEQPTAAASMPADGAAARRPLARQSCASRSACSAASRRRACRSRTVHVPSFPALSAGAEWIEACEIAAGRDVRHRSPFGCCETVDSGAALTAIEVSASVVAEATACRGSPACSPALRAESANAVHNGVGKRDARPSGMKSVVCDCIETSFSRLAGTLEKPGKGSREESSTNSDGCQDVARTRRGLCHGGQLTSKLLKLSRTGREHVAP